MLGGPLALAVGCCVVTWQRDHQPGQQYEAGFEAGVCAKWCSAVQGPGWSSEYPVAMRASLVGFVVMSSGKISLGGDQMRGRLMVLVVFVMAMVSASLRAGCGVGK